MANPAGSIWPTKWSRAVVRRRRIVVDSRGFDQITRTFANGMTRRGALKGVAAALGVMPFGALRAPTATAASSWCYQHFSCSNGVSFYLCWNKSKIKLKKLVSCKSDFVYGCAKSQSACHS
jgi:hypothetical protein